MESMWPCTYSAIDIFIPDSTVRGYRRLSQREAWFKLPTVFTPPLFPDARNHKPPTFSRKIRGLCLLNVAVKERFELSIQFLVYTLSRRAP